MADQEHLDTLKLGIDKWNKWKKEHPDIEADLSEADFHKTSLINADFIRADLIGADLSYANLTKVNFSDANLIKANLSGSDLQDANFTRAHLSRADLSGAQLFQADLSGAHLSRTRFTGAILLGANLNRAHLSEADLSRSRLNGAQLNGAHLSKAELSEADLSQTDLSGADLSYANLTGANLTEANLTDANLRETHLNRADLRKANLCRAQLNGAHLNGANLTEANLQWVNLSEADLSEANLTGCSIYAISAWNVQLEKTIQSSLIITRQDEPTITVDNLKIAQFIYLLLNNQEIRFIIETVAKKVVLILGRFTPERKAILDSLRNALRTYDYLPVMFDFEKPSTRDFTETIITLAHLSRFILADLTDPSSLPQELQAIVPQLAIAVQPLLELSKKEHSMFPDFKKYPWVLPTYHYTDQANLMQSLKEHVIDPAEQKAKELAHR
jgi:uncharacterized protein YjbI with pentapeptide repeats